ncbi:DUF4376 domain-containing protein [Leptospira kmetyi]|uniref:DUF4376 domain-containing protein n=1 Tax=Leptospira kmetyi TaxID=408139 RepID=UPI0002887584|nr:DUF4376 domain-containing protein [Leptospira kmetyi]EQA54447.1 hypothetical protein LEP1GSC052_1971 [Leptospira kmetyi serovar Malaysia str. Bejo-Iso9]TGK21675.1 DUF4376 domain-containing protein [Leptospira kmetyi]TGK28602.1 DUF4376 domain-containing protein [Leptospira kmetyi]TGL68030.1 DUF4376 domain-containing protein [Leptospira kmetyi]
MNYIIDKESKSVVWINTDPNQLEGTSAWSQFDANVHQIAYAVHYNPKIGEQFKANLENGIAKDFENRKVYHKITGAERLLQSWEDEIDLETETYVEPLKDQSGNRLAYQKYTGSAWIVDENLKKESLLLQNKQIFRSKLEYYRGTVDFSGAVWDSGKQYLENIQKTLTLYSKDKIEGLPDWRDANNTFHILSSEDLADLAERIELDLFRVGQVLYAKKWDVEEKIRSLKENEVLDLVSLWS